MKKFIFAAAALAAVMLTGCTSDKKSGNADGSQTGSGSQTTTSQSVTTTVSQSDTSGSSATGDVDGDGFLEELGTDVNDMVSDVVSGAEGVVDDVLDGTR